MALTGLPQIQAPWRDQAACTGLASREADWWCPSEDLRPVERDFQFHLARRICAECPVRVDCVVDALANLPKTGEDAMRGGLTPPELCEFARELGRPARKVLAHGTRSKYVGGCRCDDCRNAHRVYEHERRLHRLAGRPKRETTPRQKVAAQVTRVPHTADEVATACGLPLRVVRILLAEGVAAGSCVVTGRHPHGQLLYARPSREAAAA